MTDNFNDEFENLQKDFEDDVVNKQKDKLNNILWYIPFFNIWLLFVEKKEQSELSKKFNKQWIVIFIIYIFVFLILGVLSFSLSIILTLFYLWFILFLCAKAYNWIYIKIDILEDIILEFEKLTKEKK